MEKDDDDDDDEHLFMQGTRHSLSDFNETLKLIHQISYTSVQWEPSCTTQADEHTHTHTHTHD